MRSWVSGFSVIFLLAVTASMPLPAAAQMAINAGHTGAWKEDITTGQGFTIEVLPDGVGIVMAWYTYTPVGDGDSEQRWFTAGGVIGESGIAELTVYNSEGGRFDTPGGVSTLPAGELQLAFDSCQTGSLVYSLDDGRSGDMALVRITGSEMCERLAGHAEFPLYAELTAIASLQSDDGADIDCAVHYLVELTVTDRGMLVTTLDGHMGGEANRQVIPAVGDGVGFFADAHTPITVTLTADQVRIVSQLPQPPSQAQDEDSRFWRETLEFNGTLDADGTVSGNWLCSPFDTRGDDRYFAEGTWQLTPIANTPGPGDPT